MSFGAYSEANGMAAPAVRSRADLSFAVGRLCELELAEVRFCIDAGITNSVRLRIVDGRFGSNSAKNLTSALSPLIPQ